jgi:ribosome-associated heat shock protein Hsp15
MTTADRVRLDRWLWAARFVKTRALAVAVIDAGHVQVNGERAKRARPVGPGDRVRIRQGPFEHLVTVRAVSARRGPAAAARALYEEDPASRARREAQAARLKAAPAAFYDGKGRPTKKQRRELDDLKSRL